MYGIDGRRDLTESTRDDLSGYDGARPVRIGNGAFDQRQNDVYGAVLDSILLHTRRSQRLPTRGCGRSSSRRPSAPPRCGSSPTRASGRRAASRSTTCRRSSCAGWRWTGPRSWPRCAATPTLQAKWRAAAEEIHADILANGVERARACCASTTTPTRSTPRRCWPRIFGFLPATTTGCGPRVLAIADDLTEHGFVLRYRTDETDDGLSGKEGTFLICSFWLVSALAVVGEEQRARDLMERLLRVASPLGLYAEEFDTDTGHHLGNFPQAFSHLALIEAAGADHPRRAVEGADVTRHLRRHHHR